MTGLVWAPLTGLTQRQVIQPRVLPICEQLHRRVRWHVALASGHCFISVGRMLH